MTDRNFCRFSIRNHLISMVLLNLFCVSPFTADQDCGPRCLFVASEALGHDVPYPEVKEALGEPASDVGFSLLQLKEAADSLGLETQLVRTSIDRLLERSKKESFLFVAWLNSDHFVVVSDVTNDGVRVVDPPSLRWVDPLVFQKRWKGEGLLVATDALQPEDEVGKTSWFFGLAVLGTSAFACIAFALRQKWMHHFYPTV